MLPAHNCWGNILANEIAHTSGPKIINDFSEHKLILSSPD